MPPAQLLDSQLIQCLRAVPDYRCARGQRYPLWVMLLVAILGVMSGCKGYQALEEFGIRHYQTLCECLGLSFKRMPSDSTLRKMFRHLDFECLNQHFNQWVQAQWSPQAGDWLSVDGKSLKGTVTDSQDPFQSFVSVVSVYSHRTRMIIAQQGYENQAESEIHVVQSMLERLNLTGVIFSFDALHAQKKRWSNSSSRTMTI